MNIPTRLIKLTVLTAVFATAGVGCQRSNEDNVQAARENPSTATEDRGGKAALSAADSQFIKEAEQDNIKERSIGRVVAQKSTNKDVKGYAQMLVDDHTKALNKLVDLMKDNGMPQPAGLPEAKHEAEAKLSSLNGPAFDREFVNSMVQDHQKAVAKFEQEQNTAQNQSVKDYAKDILPKLREHLKKAEDLQSKLGRTSGTTSR